MTVALYLDSADVAGLATRQVVLAAARHAVDSEGADGTVLPARIDVPTESGFLRVMPAALGDVMGLKVMTLVEGLGTRYLLLVHSTASGELVGVLDAEQVTKLRTAAITALAGEVMAPEPPRRLALVGTGFEAEGHLRMLADIWPLERVHVYSRSAERRAGFAARLGAELGIDVAPMAGVADALAGARTVVLATKSREPVLDGAAIAPESVVLSIGSTRPDLRELDRGTFARAARVLADDPDQVARESGDAIEALATGAIERDAMCSLGAALADPALLERRDGRDLLVFKSVGTAVQDLALARAALTAAKDAGCGRELGELARLKPFADAVKRTVPPAVAADGGVA